MSVRWLKTKVLGGILYLYIWHWQSGYTNLDIHGEAIAINDHGEFVGYTFGTTRRAFIWFPRGGVHPFSGTYGLNTISGGSGRPNDVNNLGQVVGEDLDRGRALLWNINDYFSAVDLGTLGGCCAGATGINNKGQITGWSKTRNGDVHAVVWERKK